MDIFAGDYFCFHTKRKKSRKKVETNSPASAASGGYLARPANIYAEEPRSEHQSFPEHIPVKEPILTTDAINPIQEDETSPDMQLVFKDEIPAADEPGPIKRKIFRWRNYLLRNLRCRTKRKNKNAVQPREYTSCETCRSTSTLLIRITSLKLCRHMSAVIWNCTIPSPT